MRARRYVLCGDPIDTSPSPAMHNAGFAALNLPAHYGLLPIAADAEEKMDRLVEDVAGDTIAGANITTPLKEKLATRVELDPRAKRAGAVNTLWAERGTVRGTLTDIDGVRLPLESRGLLPLSRSVGATTPSQDPRIGVIIGSGGAARAAAIALDDLDCEVHLIARNVERAADLLRQVAPRRMGQVHTTDTSDELLSVCRVLIQATPVGKAGERHALALHLLRPASIAFEMLYLPSRTPFLASAAQAGAHTVAGWEMLLAQGRRSFQIWTGEEAPEEAMRVALRAQIDA